MSINFEAASSSFFWEYNFVQQKKQLRHRLQQKVKTLKCFSPKNIYAVLMLVESDNADLDSVNKTAVTALVNTDGGNRRPSE